MNALKKSVPKTQEKTTHKEDSKANVQSSSSVDSREKEEKRKLLLNAMKQREISKKLEADSQEAIK